MPRGARCPTSLRPHPTTRGPRARSWWTSTPRITSSATATGPAWRSAAHARSRRRRTTGGRPGASSTSDSDLYNSQLKLHRPAADTRHVRHLRLSSTVSRRIAVALALQTVAVGLLATGALGTSKEAPQVAAPQPSAAVSVDNDVSAPLADVPAPATDAPPALPELERQTQATVSSEVRDQAVQSAIGGANVAAPVDSFDGLRMTALTTHYVPPDPVGDVGPTQYVQAVNGGLDVFAKNGQDLSGAIDDSSFWSGITGCEVDATRGLTDPTLNYDQFADRWVYAELSYPVPPHPTDDWGASYMCVAVSTSGDATGSWNRYSFRAGNTPRGGVLPDYPKLGVWPDGYYLSFNDFDNVSPHNFVGAGAMVLDRASMLLGNPAQSIFFDLRGTSGLTGGMLPADADGTNAPAAGEPNHFLAPVDDPTDVNDQLGIWDFHVDWAIPGNSYFHPAQALRVSAFNGNGVSVSQPGTTNQLDGLADDRLMNRNQYRSFAGYSTLVTNLTVRSAAGSDAPRWFELRHTSSAWSVNQDSTFAPSATSRWVGSAAMDGAGDIALGYTAGDAATYPGLRYTGRLVSDPLNAMQAEATLIAGGGSQTSTPRWGDYTQLTVDPVDDCTFWYTGEYNAATVGADWHTLIGSFRFPSCVTSSGPQYSVVPAVSGTLREGQAVVSTAGTWAPAPTSTAYQWRRCDSHGLSCIDIPGAASFTYVLQAADAGYRVRSKVTVSAATGTSSAISAVTGTVRPLAPSNSVAPSITGTPQVAQTLTAVNGSWSTYPGVPNGFTYEWDRCSVSGCAAIPNATNSAYTLVGADQGATIQVKVTATTIGGATTATSAQTRAVTPPPPPVNVVAPRVTGTAQVNQILIVQAGTWTGVAPIGYTYQWQRCTPASTSCSAIPGAIGATYRVTTADVGSAVRVAVTATNSGGATSVNTIVTPAAVPLAPVLLAPPIVSGSVTYGSTLTTSDGSWSGGPLTYSYQWQLCNPGCADVLGADDNAFVLGAGTVGGTVRVVVTTTNAGGSTSVTSGATDVVTDPRGATAGGTPSPGGSTGGGGSTDGGGSPGRGGSSTGGGGGSTGGGSGGGAGAPDLVVSGFASRMSVVTGDTVTFALTVTDKNGVTAQQLHLDLALSAALQYVSATMDRGSGCVPVDAAHVQCSLEFLSSTSPSAHIQVTTKVLAAGTQTLSATASAAQGELAPADNTVSVAVDAVSASTGTPSGLNGNGTPTKAQDKKKPTARALASTGTRGRASKLRFKVYDDHGVAKVTAMVRLSGRAVGTARTGFGPVAYNHVYFLGWKVPAKAA